MEQKKLRDFRLYVTNDVEKKWKRLTRQHFGKVNKYTLGKTLSKALDLLSEPNECVFTGNLGRGGF